MPESKDPSISVIERKGTAYTKAFFQEKADVNSNNLHLCLTRADLMSNFRVPFGMREITNAVITARLGGQISTCICYIYNPLVTGDTLSEFTGDVDFHASGSSSLHKVLLCEMTIAVRPRPDGADVDIDTFELLRCGFLIGFDVCTEFSKFLGCS